MNNDIDFDKPLKTEHGKKVAIFTTKAEGVFPVVGQIEGDSSIYRWTKRGVHAFSDNYRLVNVKESIIVPLGPGDIKVGDIIRYKNQQNTWQMVVAVKKDSNGNYYFVAGVSSYYFDKKTNDLLLSHDNGNTWQEFTKEIEA